MANLGVLALCPSGSLGAVMLSLGIIGAALGLLAAVLNRRRWGFLIGVAALLSAMTVSGLGAVGMLIEREHVDTAARTMPTDTARHRARRAGYERAKRAPRAGLILAAAPLFGGLAGVLPPFLRRRRPKPQSVRMPRSIRSHTRHELDSKTGATSVSTMVLAIAAFLVCAIALSLPLPGPDLARASPAWDAREAIDVMKLGRTREGCLALEDACRKECNVNDVPELRSAVSECFELRLAEAAEGADPAARLEALRETALPLTEEQRQRLRVELAPLRR